MLSTLDFAPPRDFFIGKAAALELRAEDDEEEDDLDESDELEVSRLDPCVHIPMDEVESRLAELDPNAKIAVLCRSGRRSATITNLLLANGFTDVRNITSGINGWAATVDPSLKVY